MNRASLACSLLLLSAASAPRSANAEESSNGSSREAATPIAPQPVEVQDEVPSPAAPIEATPIHPTPIEATPIHPTPLNDQIGATPIHPAPIEATPIHPTPAEVEVGATPIHPTPLPMPVRTSTDVPTPPQDDPD